MHGLTGPLLAFEFDLYDRGTESVKTLRLCNYGPLAVGVGPGRVQFLPRLKPPVLIGSRISAETYEPPFREVANGGQVQFAIDSDLWPWLDYDMNGRPARGYLGTIGDRFEDLSLVYRGRIAGFSHDTLTGQFALTDARIDLDTPLVPMLYGDDALSELRGRPMPELHGTGYSLAPTLEDSANQIWRVSRLPLDDVMNLRVGGILWRRAGGVPKSGQWYPFLSEGRVQLGSNLGGGELRVDARAVGWETMTTAQLMQLFVGRGGGQVDTAAMIALERAAPGIVGWYTTTDPVNRLDAFDMIMAGIVGYWGLLPTGEVTAGVIEAPGEATGTGGVSSFFSDTLTWDGDDLTWDGDPLTWTTFLAAVRLRNVNGNRININGLRLTQLIPPVWRLRVECRRNWQPFTQFFTNVTEAEQQAFRAGGVVVPPYTNEGIKRSEPLAVDAPLIRSLLVNEADALAVRDRAALAWGRLRRLYEAEAFIDDPRLYQTSSVDYETVTGLFRAHAAMRSLGGGPAQVQWWG